MTNMSRPAGSGLIGTLSLTHSLTDLFLEMLPLMVIHGESTADIAQQVDFGFEVLAKIKGVEAREIYKEVDVHMTDSTEHNKGVAKVLQVKFKK